MPVHTVLRRVAWVALASVTACATAPRAHRAAYERHLALPTDVAAAIAAGALRQGLPFADPVPQAAGAPANVVPGGFEIVYERQHQGPWVPCATHRLTVRASGTAPAAVQVERPAGRLALPGFGARAADRLRVLVVAHGPGTVVRADLPDELTGALDRAFALAADPEACCAGLAEPNLAAFAADRARAEAQRRLATGDAAGAEAWLLRARRLNALTAGQQRQLGELAAAGGNVLLARRRLGEAALLTDDPALRAALAARLAQLVDPAADHLVRAHDVAGAATPAERARAAARLHTQRRLQPDPIVDYRLQGQLHQGDQDEMAALACALLAREHTPTAAVVRGPDASARGLDDFRRRITLAILPVAAGGARDAMPLPAAPPSH